MKKKIIYSFLFVLCLLFIFSSTSLANGIKTYFSSGGKSNVDMETVTSNVYTILYTFGIILAVCILVTIAISYMVATPNKKAQLKERLIYYFAGVIFLVGGLAFLRTYEKVANDVGDVVRGKSTHQAQSYTDENGEVHYTDDSVEMISNSCKLKQEDILAMTRNELETFIDKLDYAIDDIKIKVASGEVDYPNIDRSIGECEANLAYARELLTAYKKADKMKDI